MTAATLDFPTLAGYTVRAYRGAADLPALRDVLAADQQADGRESVVTLAELENYYQHLTNCDPARDMLLVEGPAGLVAYGRAAWSKAANAAAYEYPLAVHVRPEARGQGLGRALLAWLEARTLALSAELGHAQLPGVTQHWQAEAADRETARIAVLERAGYTPVRYFYEMVRPDLENIPAKRLPPGLELRPARPEDYRPIWDAATEAFQDHWGEAEVSESDYERFRYGHRFQPEIWKVAWDVAQNEVAGMVLGYILFDENEQFHRQRGWTENICVRRPYRKQGVASALIAENLHELKARGMTEAALGVDSESPTGALGVYEAMGFRRVDRLAVYRKSFPR